MIHIILYIYINVSNIPVQYKIPHSYYYTLPSTSFCCSIRKQKTSVISKNGVPKKRWVEFPCPTNPTNEVEAEPSVTSTSTSTCGKKGVSPELLETVKAPSKGGGGCGREFLPGHGEEGSDPFFGTCWWDFFLPPCRDLFFQKTCWIFSCVCQVTIQVIFI